MNTTITSPHNPHLKALKRLQTRRERARSGAFVAEGEDLVAAARAAGRPALEGYRAAGCGLGEEEGFLDVEQSALASVSTLGSGTRVMAVYPQVWSRPVGPLCVYLHGVKDPGNVGAILRAAHAFGASCVAFGPRCADPHSPKAVRASMGAIFGVPIARVDESALSESALSESAPSESAPSESAPSVPDLAALPGERVALVAHDGEPLRTVVVDGPLTLLVGAEREGLPAAVLDACERRAQIPIAAQAESLNAAMAATVALYEATREQIGRGGEAVPAPAPSSRVRA